MSGDRKGSTLRWASVSAVTRRPPGPLKLRSPPVLSRQLLLAYRKTDYFVDMGPGIVLHVGQSSKEAGELLGAAGVSRALLVTACNPFSVALDDATNKCRMDWLDRWLRSHRLKSFPALGRDPSGLWPPEVSRLVLDPSDREIVDLLVLGQQHAAVIVTAAGTACFVLHPEHARREARKRNACDHGEHLVRFDLPTGKQRSGIAYSKKPVGEADKNLLCRIVPHNGGVVVAHKERANHIAHIHRAISSAKTWAEFRKAMPAKEYSAIVRGFDDQGEPRPKGNELFSGDALPGWPEGDYPPWLQQEMTRILPRDLLDCHGRGQATFVSGDYCEIPGERLELLIADLQSLGWNVKFDDCLPFH